MSGQRRRRDLASFQLDAQNFSAALALGRVRIAALGAGSRGLDPEAIPAVIHELHVQQEELSVAEEELRAQLDELAITTTRARAERDRYRALFDQSPDGYFLTDSLGVIRDVNVAAAELVNVEARFLVGKPLAALVDVADTRLLRERLSELRSRDALEVGLRLRPRGGEPTWCGFRAAVLRDGSGILWVARDTQSQPMVRGALSCSQHYLPGVHTPRVAELERANRDKEDLLARERRLREELVMADAAKDRLIGVLSHDLRGPLHSVLAWTQLLRREPLDGKARDRALATIEQNARAQVRLLDELLDISRVASDSVQIERVAIDLGLLAQREVDALATSAQERAIVVESVLAPDAVVIGDYARIQHLLRTLLARALAAVSRAGRIVLRVDADAVHARIVVEDDGRGIAPELAPFLFDLVGAGSRDDGLSGDAVGLYIVRRVAELHEGTVTAESDGVDRGSRLTVTLPLPSTARRAPPAVAAGRLTGVRVLVVDDDADARELMTVALEMNGATAATVDSSNAALEAFDSVSPHVVVTDLSMPGMNGQDLAHQLRARPTSLATAFVLVTGYSGKHADGAGTAFDAEFTKPVDLHALVTTLERLVTGQR